MVVSEAIVTSRGGMTSHAAVVARGMGGVQWLDEQLTINEKLNKHTMVHIPINEGDLLSEMVQQEKSTGVKLNLIRHKISIF